MTEAEKARFLGPFPEALFVAVLTAGAYWLAFRYEAGYLSAFGLPAHFAEVSLNTVLFVALALSGAAWVVFWVINLVLMLWPQHPAIQEKIFRVVIILLFPFWHLINYGFRAQDWIVYTATLVFVAIFEFFWPLLVFREKGSLRERFIADEIAESRVRERGIAGRLLVAFGPAAYSLLLLFLVGSILAQSAGRAKAMTQKEYLVFADAPDIAVIRMYPETIVAMPFDRQTRTVQSRVIVRKIGTENLALTLKPNLGPLERRRSEIGTQPQQPTRVPNQQIQPTAKGGG